MFETSPQTAELDEALARAQEQMQSALKDKTNPSFKSKYADLEAIWEVARPVLGRYDIALTQWPVTSPDGWLHLVTRISYKGQFMQSTMNMPIQKGRNDAQAYGSAITYAKRYAICAALGITTAAERDDDGNAASVPPPPIEMEYREQPSLLERLKSVCLESGITNDQAVYSISKKLVGEPINKLKTLIPEVIKEYKDSHDDKDLF